MIFRFRNLPLVRTLENILQMKKIGLIISLIFLLPLIIFGQKNIELTFDIEDFNQKAKTAEWLYMYDAIAWWTSDSVMTQNPTELERLGKEWFCFQSSDNNWHAIYGKYEDNEFDLVFHYLVDTLFSVKRIYDPVDTIF